MPGLPGRFKIIVNDSHGGRTEYASPFDLELVSFDVVGENEILEPDSLVSIDNVEIRNRGGMPSPANYTVRVLLESRRLDPARRCRLGDASVARTG